MNIKRLPDKLPCDFSFFREGEKLIIFKTGWEHELRKIGALYPGKLEKAYPGIKYLRGRGRPLLVPSRRGKIVIRHYHHGGLFRWLTRDLLGSISRPLNELRMLEAARGEGINAPAPVGSIITPAPGGLIRADLITVFIPDSVDLISYLKDWRGKLSLEMIRENYEIVARAAKEVRKLHRRGIYHSDLQLKNLLLQKSAEGKKIFILDFDKAYRVAFLTRREAVKNLLRFYRSFRKIRVMNPAVPRRGALRFLVDYAPEDREIRKHVIRKALRRKWKDFFHLKRWKFLLKLRADIYPRPPGYT